jgi:DNA-binding response OmpR family regulator
MTTQIIFILYKSYWNPKIFKVDTAHSGEEALKKILKYNYALIILDVQMPDMDGFEVAENIAGFSKTKETPIIFLSAVNTDKRFITKGYDSGGLDYVTKPVDPDILMLKSQNILSAVRADPGSQGYPADSGNGSGKTEAGAIGTSFKSRLFTYLTGIFTANCFYM